MLICVKFHNKLDPKCGQVHWNLLGNQTWNLVPYFSDLSTWKTYWNSRMKTSFVTKIVDENKAFVGWKWNWKNKEYICTALKKISIKTYTTTYLKIYVVNFNFNCMSRFFSRFFKPQKLWRSLQIVTNYRLVTMIINSQIMTVIKWLDLLNHCNINLVSRY